MLFHIIDSPPHGREVLCSSDNFRDGCPCKKSDYKSSLERFKNRDVHYYFISWN